ncbi:MAG: GNAT family N-acetyltransferase [Candidatus Omnitrophota bacterium]
MKKKKSEIPHTDLTFLAYKTASDVPLDIWERYNARKHPFRSMNFYMALERAFPERKYSYIVGKIKDTIKMFLIVSCEPLDLNAFLPGFMKRFILFVRKWKPEFFTLVTGMSGCLETSMEHWWFEEEFELSHIIVQKIHDKIRSIFPAIRIMVFRDFTCLDNKGQILKKYLLTHEFIDVLNFPNCIIARDNFTLDEHYNRLNKKARANVRNSDRLKNQHELSIEKVKIDENILEKVYPLYLQVHERAETFQRPPFPKEFFKEIMKHMGNEVHFLLVIDKEAQIQGFILGGLSDRIYCPYMIGLNYQVAYQYSLYRILLWEAIKVAFNEEVQEIDLGITSYFIKQDYGSELVEMKMLIRFYPTFVHKMIKPLIKKIFDSPQPTKRRPYKISAQ